MKKLNFKKDNSSLIDISISNSNKFVKVSNVTGENLDLLKMFMNLLSSRSPNTDDQPPEFQIDDTYSVPGIDISAILYDCDL